ncbi:MAG: type IX secretion system sortase PorU [Candidatus Kapaibacteriales bacterium]
MLFLFLFFPFGLSANDCNFKVLEETDTTLKILYSNELISLDTILISSKVFLNPIIPNTILKEANHSTPSCYVSLEAIALPKPNGFKIKNVQIIKSTLIDGKIIPVPETNQEGTKFSFVPSLYKNYKQEQVKINYLGIARNLHLGQLSIPVAQYLPELNKIQILLEILIEIEFPKTQNYICFNNHTPLVLNPNQAKSWILDLTANGEFINQKNSDIPLTSANKVVKIKVEKEGIYKIEVGMLTSLGINIKQEEIPTIKIFGGNGKPLSELPSDAMNFELSDIPIIVVTKSNGDLDYILFYGIGTTGFEFNGKDFTFYSNPFGNANYYYLSWGGSQGKRITTDTSMPCSNPEIQTTYYERIAYKEEISNPFSSGSGRIWFGGSIFPRTFTNLLEHLDRTKPILYRFYVGQKYQSDNTQNKGTFSFFESSNLMGQISINATYKGSYEEARASFFQTQFNSNKISSDNRSYLIIDYTTNEPAKATPYFNSYEIQYSRQLIAKDNSISFYTDPNLSGCQIFQIQNFDSEPIGFDVTNPRNPILVNNNSPVAGTFFIQTSLLPNSPKRFIITNKFFKPEITLIDFENLQGKKFDAEVLVITHNSLVNSASKYIQYRSEKSNIKCALVTIDKIFDEFSFGIPDPLAIRYFLAHLMKTQEVKPRYVILWGDGHFDYKQITTNQTNFIPPYESFDSYTSFNSTVSFTSDDFFAFIIGNDNVIDLSIARIPVTSDKSGLDYVNKIKEYESNSDPGNWRCTFLLTADDSPANISDNQYDGAIHTSSSEILSRNFIPRDIIQKKIYLVEYPTERIQSGRRKPLASLDLINSINEGALVVNWTGHGNPRVWAHEELFDRDKTISQLSNKNALFFGIAATCDFGRFDMTNVSSGMEDLIFFPKGGAIGFFTATRAVSVSDNSAINQTFLNYSFRRNKNLHYDKLGDIYFNVKSVRSNTNDIKYQLYADPLLKLNLPELIVKPNKINGILLDTLGKPLEIKAMSLLTIEGNIQGLLDSLPLLDFNGNVEIVINDVSYIKNVSDVDGSLHSILKDGGIITRGTFPVRNGFFKAEFIIPEELSFLDGTITIRFFAKDLEYRTFAKGFYNNIRINGIDSILSVDNTPPNINIFINDTTFRENDVVSNPPLLIVVLSDNSGINTTGSGIGHRIECWIDDRIEPIDLTDKYESSENDPKSGFIKTTIYGLAQGLHSIRVRAWDIFNNFSVAETKFRILDESAQIYLYNLTTIPNPATNILKFRFQHNLHENFHYQIEVFTTLGNLIFSTIQEFSNPLTIEYQWNLIDNNGNALPTGTYFYKISVYGNNKKVTQYGKFSIIN